MSLTIVTSKQVIVAPRNKPIIMVATETIFPPILEEKTESQSRWSKSETSEKDLPESAPEDATTEPASNTPIISISPKAFYGIFLENDLTNLFEKVYANYAMFRNEPSGHNTTIEDLAKIAFDQLNPKLVLRTGPIVLNAVLNFLWLIPLGETRMCYILAREEFVACFLSWLSTPKPLSEIPHNSIQNSRRFTSGCMEGGPDSLTFKRFRVQMPIGRECCQCQKRNYMDVPYSVCTPTENSDNGEIPCPVCSRKPCHNCEVMFGWF